MAKTIILKNQTTTDLDFTSIGETLLGSSQLDVSRYSATKLRNDNTLLANIVNGNIIVNDGSIDLNASLGSLYVSNDTINDDDGFWYGNRRRFSILWNQTNHGFVEGEVVRLDENTGLAVKAIADSHANSATTVIVMEVVDANSFYAGLPGSSVTNINASSVEGGLPLSSGSAYFLSLTVPGQITPNIPIGAGQIVKLIGFATSSTSLTFLPNVGYENETALTSTEATKAQSGGSIVRTPNSWQRPVISMNVNDPSSLTPLNGDRYIVGTSPVGVWSTQTNKIAEYVASSASWNIVTPLEGFLIFDKNTAEVYYFDGTNWILLVPQNNITDLASVTLGFNTSFLIPQTMTDVNWDITHLENNTSVLQHDTLNSERVLVKETGLYFINFSLSFDADPFEEQISAQVVRNGTTVVPGSFRLASEDDEINDLSNAFTALLTAGDYITLQISANGAGNLLHNSTNFCITRAQGTKGDPGPTGSGSNINVKQDNVSVINTPHSILNFNNMEVSDTGIGQVDIKNIVGSEFQIAQSLGFSTTTSTIFQNKVTLTTSNLPAGIYRIGIHYGWNHNAVTNDFESIVLEDGIQIGNKHKQEPKDSAGGDPTGTTQRYFTSRVFYRTLTAGSHEYKLQFRTDNSGTTSSIFEATIELWRVG